LAWAQTPEEISAARLMDDLMWNRARARAGDFRTRWNEFALCIFEHYARNYRRAGA
jgi:hypothetical protein